MSTLEVKELAAPSGFDLKIAAGETLDLRSQGIVTMPAGAILQVVGATHQGNVVITSTSFAAHGLQATITPKSSSSKILITTLCGYSIPSNDGIYFNIERNVGGSGTNLASHIEAFGGAQAATYRGCHTLNYLDSPSTTSAITYKLLIRTQAGNTVEAPAWSNAKNTITLQEVAG
jgi:hypothetical protein